MRNTFISGHVVATVKYNDRTDQYKVKLCPSKPEARGCATVEVGAPASGPRSTHGKRISVDDPRAYRNAVHAALSFAPQRIQDEASGNRRGTGWFIRPLRKKARKARR